MRIALGIEYDGSGFSGWQTQRAGRTVQQLVEQAVSSVADHRVQIQCAGRTDAGVHASYQVIHFDTRAIRPNRSWVLGTNVNLPPEVSITWARPVPEAFHARFSATRRTYVYVICNRPTKPGLWHGRLTWECRALDPVRMAQAAGYWLGEHDFSSFRASGCQARHPVRTIHRFEVDASEGIISLEIEANAFLQHMVRNFAGVLIEIGIGKRDPEWAVEVLDRKDRECGGVTAPPHGLYLTAVTYPTEFALPPPASFEPALPAFAGRAFD
jgi:tRNA pseudouridine38-40 synthase